MPPAITVENLAKRYRISHESTRASYRTLRESLVSAATSLWRRGIGDSPSSEDFWALNDVSFDVQEGEVVGIIGRNGAGKSTLLKILSRITKPTRGRAVLRGRVASLLEVGTGFHPELTGRENTFLNGAILGMNRREIARKFDEIVAFAEIERFLDTPVKRYSSGMYVRLAFAIAAHLEPDILIVDEVLAVGDAGFQKKCLGKMGQVSREGRTVLFVSHNMQAVSRLCTHGILLADGQVVANGRLDSVIHAYLSDGQLGTAQRVWENPARRPGNHVAKLAAVRVRDSQGVTQHRLDIRLPVRIEMEYEVLVPGHHLVPNFHVYNSDGVCVFVAADGKSSSSVRQAGRYSSSMLIPGNFLSEGTLMIGAALSTMDPVTVHFFEPDAISFEVVDSLDGNSARGNYAGPIPGVIRPIFDWEHATDLPALPKADENR